MLSLAEENHIKTIYSLELMKDSPVNTTLIAKKLLTKASSVTDMIQKLAEKKLINYEKYKGVSLTLKGRKTALKIVRNHRLWETFLVNKLHYNWDEVHELAEQLEHIKSDTLIDKLEVFLDFPTHDPHGDPIPNAKGEMRLENTILLRNAKVNVQYKVSCVKDSSKALLQFLDKHTIHIDSELTVLDKFDFDDSMTVKLGNGTSLTLSNKVSANVYVNLK